MVFMIKMELGDLNEIPALWQDNLTKLLSFPDKMSLKKGNVPGSGAGRMSVAVPDYPGSGQGMRQGRQLFRSAEAACLSNTRRSAPAEAAMRDGGPHFQGRPDVKRTMEVFANRIFAVSAQYPGHP